MSPTELVEDLAACLCDASWDNAAPGTLLKLLDSLPNTRKHWRRKARKLLAGMIAARIWRAA